MKQMYSNRILSIAAVMTILAFFIVPATFAADKSHEVTFSTGTTATVNAGDDFVFAITCQPPTDITEIKASAGTLKAEKTTLGGPSTPQGIINGLWTLSDITGDVTITLILNTLEGADLPEIITGKAEAEAAASSAGGPGGPPPEGGAPGATPPEGGTPPEAGAAPAGGWVANSPHVGDGPTGQGFIDVLDSDKDGKVDHDEWEKNKLSTVYKSKRWPEYNKNMDDYITVDEAPQKGVNWEEAPAE